MTKTRLNLRSAAAGLKTREVRLTLKAVSDDGVIEGYGSVFGVEDSWGDVMAPGCFLSSLANHRTAGTMPAMLWQHQTDGPCGVWLEMAEDAMGLRVKGRLALDTTLGREALALLRLGAISGLSIGFVYETYTDDRETGVRTVHAADLWEVSLVTFPANGKARVTNVKAALDGGAVPKDAERVLREAGFSKTDATALVSRVMRMGEERREAADRASRAQRAAERLLETLTRKD